MTEASTGTGTPARAALPAGPVWQAGLLAATVLNGVVWFLLQQVFDVGLEIPSQPGGTDLTSLPLSAVLFITAFASPALQAEACAAGVRPGVAKPRGFPNLLTQGRDDQAPGN